MRGEAPLILALPQTLPYSAVDRRLGPEHRRCCAGAGACCPVVGGRCCIDSMGYPLRHSARSQP